MNCPTCKNEMNTRRIPKRNQGPYGVTVWERQHFCPYCEWKGTTGPGKQLRDIIKETNR